MLLVGRMGQSLRHLPRLYIVAGRREACRWAGTEGRREGAGSAQCCRRGKIRLLRNLDVLSFEKFEFKLFCAQTNTVRHYFENKFFATEWQYHADNSPLVAASNRKF
jgi:hypothetical protein